MPQLTPRDDVRKAASEILKRVDQLIKAGEIDHAIREIIHAKEIDPSNVYVHAYEERLAFLKEEHEKNAARETTRKEVQHAAQKRDDELRARTEEVKQVEAKKVSENVQERLEPHIVVREETTVREEQKLDESGIVGTSPQESIYVKAFRKMWSSAAITPQHAVALEQLGKELGISPERQLQLEHRLHQNPQPDSRPANILVIDDDEKMLSLIAQMLSYHGYEVTALQTSDEAYTLLKKWKPGLILCDVNLETSTMGGFSFYEKIRHFEHLKDVPFLFLTGLSDEILVRTGKELGVDDYLTKPISEQSLVATIKGKLKRFSELKGKS